MVVAGRGRPALHMLLVREKGLTLFLWAPYNATVHPDHESLQFQVKKAASYALARSSRWFQVPVAGLCSGLMSDRLGLLSVS